MCRLVRALYGHPESGAHWEKHLTKHAIALGGIEVNGHPSSFWFSKERMLLTVYVDDLLLSGPSQHHEFFWRALGKNIDIDAPEQLSRFLGRAHIEVSMCAPPFNQCTLVVNGLPKCETEPRCRSISPNMFVARPLGEVALALSAAWKSHRRPSGARDGLKQVLASHWRTWHWRGCHTSLQ